MEIFQVQNVLEQAEHLRHSTFAELHRLETFMGSMQEKLALADARISIFVLVDMTDEEIEA